MITLTTSEANLAREWFDNVQDLNPAYLQRKDFILAKRLYENLEMRVPSRVEEGAKQDEVKRG